MKKFLSLIMAIALVLSLCITVSADEETTNPPANTGSITITNATIDQTYKVYKIFSASYDDTTSSNKAVSYIIDEDCPYADILLGKTAPLPSGKKLSDYFNYVENTGAVTKKDATVDSELIAYLTEVVDQDTTKFEAEIKATESKITFTGLDYGYYLITSTLGTVVTINSTTPSVSVIDKNQKPAVGFEKLIQTGTDDNGNPTWDTYNTASVGEKVTYKITFKATNYDGSALIKYYSIHDTFGTAIYPDFTSIELTVGGETLDKGYYLCHMAPGTSTGHKSEAKIGTWDGESNDAEWYLVQVSDTEFRISIPWLDGHSLEAVTGSTITTHKLNFATTTSKFTSPIDVTLTYDAVIEANADIGGGATTNLINTARVSWVTEHDNTFASYSQVYTNVYGLGLIKEDGSTHANLAGAEFKLYKDQSCTDDINVIPTGIEGVYIVDSTVAHDGINHDTVQDSRTYYGFDEGATATNLVVSQVNGRLVILGLKEGTYYLKETKAPDGYNSLAHPVSIEVSAANTAGFSIFADASGEVADIQQEDGVHTEHIYRVASLTVENSQGVELPSTGGTGTMLLITIGSIVAMAFAVLLITHKKMSVYTD
ncbi:MAG: LPXTG cell wall anchor domain-containing protein [Ruminococcaceae bacterium]|nr:LPXTG cell wall anchor domain-containing protein [Oscillospiraceae bacterium]